MSLVNLTNFWANKSIKLSDAFQVLIKYTSEDDYKELFNCNGFSIPKVEYNEETLDYGNVSQVFLVPKYDSNRELTLDFYELMDNNNKSNIIHKVFEKMGYELTQKYGHQGLSTNKGDYDLDKYINTIEIRILDNKLWKYIYFYRFTNLKVSNYTMYSLDAQSDNAVKVSVTFTFEGSARGTMNQGVDYSQPPNENQPIDKGEYQEEEIELNELIKNKSQPSDFLPIPSDEEIAELEMISKMEKLNQMKQEERYQNRGMTRGSIRYEQQQEEKNAFQEGIVASENYNYEQKTEALAKMQEDKQQELGRAKGEATRGAKMAYEEGLWGNVEYSEKQRQDEMTNPKPKKQVSKNKNKATKKATKKVT